MVPVKSFMIPREKFVTVARDTDAQTAARIMRDRGIGSLFITNDKEIIGIVTDTDMMRRVVASGSDATKTSTRCPSSPNTSRLTSGVRKGSRKPAW